MAIPSFAVELFTPASDVVTVADGVDFNIAFGRAGSDLFYPYDPLTDTKAPVKIDILFGNIFDNTAAEYKIITAITGDPIKGIPGNSLAILDKNVNPQPGAFSSVGKNTYVFGNQLQSFYTQSNPLSLTTTDPLGLNQFAVIYDFNPLNDRIQLYGKRENYTLIKVNNLPVQGVGNFSGYGLFSIATGLPDLVSLIVEKPSVTLALDQKYFQFVGNQPPKDPKKKELGQFGTTGFDAGNGIATDSKGNLYVTGSTTGDLFGKNQGSSDVWLAKYDSKGKLLFKKQFGSSAGDEPYRVVTDKDGNFYLAGTTGGNLFNEGRQSFGGTDAWVAKYDSNGNLLWGHQIGENTPGVTTGFSTSGFGLQVDGSGSVYLSGLTIKANPGRFPLDFPVQDDSFVIKFDKSGTQQWYTEISDPNPQSQFNQIGAPYSQHPFFDENYSLATDTNGNSYAVGWTQGISKEADPSRLLLKYDAYISKVDATGTVQWTQQFGSKDQGVDFAWGNAIDSKGNIYVSGWTTGAIGSQNYGSYDDWLAKFDPNGTMLWAKQVGSRGDDGQFSGSLAIDKYDNIFMDGYTNGDLGKGEHNDTSYNAWVGMFDTNGNNKWIQQFGVNGQYTNATRLAVNNTGQVFVTGYTTAYLGTPLNSGFQSGGGMDAFVAALNVKDGTIVKFIGNDSTGVISQSLGPVATQDISQTLVTAAQLPNGGQGIAKGVDYGQISANLGAAYDPNSPSSITSALGKALGNSFQNLKTDKLTGQTLDISQLTGQPTIVIGDSVNGANPGLGSIETLKGTDRKDLFMLGDATNGVYYVGKGKADYALIDGFKLDQGDTIQLSKGTGSYSLQAKMSANSSGLPDGTGILYDGDLIGIVKGVNSGLSLSNTNQFAFV